MREALELIGFALLAVVGLVVGVPLVLAMACALALVSALVIFGPILAEDDSPIGPRHPADAWADDEGGGYSADHWTAQLEDRLEVRGQTVPEAICRAALAALESR